MASEQKRLFLALILSGLVLFTWQTYFAPKTPVVIEKDIPANTTPKASKDAPLKDNPVAAMPETKEIATETVLLERGETQVSITNKLEIINFTNSNVTDTFENTVGTGRKLQFYKVDNNVLVPLNMAFTSTDASLVNGVDEANGISFTASVDHRGILNWMLTSANPMTLAFKVVSDVKESESRQVRQFVHLLDDVKRFNVDDEEVYEGTSKWFGIDFHYHLFAMVFNKPVVSQTFVKGNTFLLKTLEASTQFGGFANYSLKELDSLQEVGHKLDLSIDYGIFGIIAVPILKGLKFFYSFIPNYGVAIILITLLIRTLLFPLQFKSFKSMKKMQKLQPELQKIKEKFKDDPQRVQRETMEVFKKSGANPMGGCLPMLLQMPVFFAMYQVFLHSVELLDAPFILWITDLSSKDPYYVLPVLMGVFFFLQFKLNPSTTADPNQQKIMMIMPLIFPFFMKDLPAGLNLYMLISTSFGILQQIIVYKVIDD